MSMSIFHLHIRFVQMASFSVQTLNKTINILKSNYYPLTLELSFKNNTFMSKFVFRIDHRIG